jgi:hypothetical protein
MELVWEFRLWGQESFDEMEEAVSKAPHDLVTWCAWLLDSSPSPMLSNVALSRPGRQRTDCAHWMRASCLHGGRGSASVGKEFCHSRCHDVVSELMRRPAPEAFLLLLL